MYNDARADPDIFYNEDDGYYFLTGSTYEVKSTDSTNNQKDATVPSASSAPRPSTV